MIKDVNYSLLKRKGEILTRIEAIKEDVNFKAEVDKLRMELDMIEKTLRSLNRG